MTANFFILIFLFCFAIIKFGCVLKEDCFFRFHYLFSDVVFHVSPRNIVADGDHGTVDGSCLEKRLVSVLISM